MNSSQNPNVISELSERLLGDISRSVYGHHQATKLIIGAFLIGGHVLVEGPPGIAKTLLAKEFARTLGLSFRRIQFTPDLMPSDITGVNVFDPQSGNFRFAPGPIFADIVLADEINRTPPKTQAALLEAMEERQLTVDGQRRGLGDMFFVLATQNPIEHEGTFPLPEAQLDRFLFKIKLSYPDRDFEQEMIQKLSSTVPNQDSEETPKAASVSIDELRAAKSYLRNITLSPAISRYIVEICETSRNHPYLLLGASPRAGLHLALASKFIAAASARSYVIPDDVQAALYPVLEHRMILQPEAYDLEQGVSEFLTEIFEKVQPPSEIT